MKLKGSKISSKFSLQRAKLPHQEKGREVLIFTEPEPTTDKITEKKREEPQELSEKLRPVDYSTENLVYSRMLDINPILAELVGEFNLAHTSTGEKPKRVLTWATEAPQKATFTPRPVEKLQTNIKRAKKETIAEFTARILEGYNSYSREELLERIKTDAQVDNERAFKGFIKMKKDRIIFKTPFHTYYLSTSTPF